MPGTVVRDALEPDLLEGVNLAVAGPTSGDAYEIGWAGDVQFVLDVTTADDPVSVDIQGCETSDFSTADVVTLGTIVGSALGSFALTTYVDARYVRAVATSGASSTTVATVKPVLPHDRRVRGKHPTSKALV